MSRARRWWSNLTPQGKAIIVASAGAGAVAGGLALRSSIGTTPGWSAPRCRVARTNGYLIGVDVSTWQKEIDWDRVCGEGISFAFVRATFDGDVVDKYFERNWTECGRIGIYRSPYHFAVPPLSNSKHARQHNPVGGPRDQAEHFYSTVGKLSRDRDLPPVLDMEWHAETISDTAEWCREFLVRTEALFKRTPIIYTSTNFVKNHMGNPRWLRRYLFWQAYWTDASSPPSAIPGFPWTFWQYSNRGEVDGIPTVVDMCRFYGSLDKLQQVAAGRILPPRPLPAAA